MEENQSAAAAPAAPEPGVLNLSDSSSMPSSDPAPSTEAAAPAQSDNNDSSATPSATDPAIVPDATPDTTTPDRGIDPDKGIDPDAGDQPAQTPTQPQNDPSQMTEAQRNAYYYQLRNSAKQGTEQVLSQHYQPEAKDDIKDRLLQEGYDDFQAEVLADREVQRQEKELGEISAEVSDLNSGLAVEALEVVSTIPWLNPSHKEAFGDGRLAHLASQMYENFVTRDERTAQRDPRTGQPIPGTGTIIEARLTPMQFYGALDQIRSSGASTAGQQAQRNAERQMAAVAPPTSVTTSRDVPYEQMSPQQKKAYLESKGHNFG